MFKIGDFSRISQVSVKTLHLYDEMGLLKPAHVDQKNGYRYYSAHQMSRLSRILILKQLGFSLEQVMVMLDSDIQPVQIREMLQARRNQIADQLLHEQEKLSMVEARLRQIESEGGNFMSQHNVLIKKVDPIRVYSKRQLNRTPEDAVKLVEDVWSDLVDANARKIGPTIAIYCETEHKENDFEMEAAMPIAPGSSLQTMDLPVIDKAACMVYNGSYEGLNAVYGALAEWIEQNGYRIAGYCRTVYLTCAETETDPAKFVTEIQVPVEKA